MVKKHNINETNAKRKTVPAKAEIILFNRIFFLFASCSFNCSDFSIKLKYPEIMESPNIPKIASNSSTKPPPFSFLLYHKTVVLSSEIFGKAECEIIYSVNCEISRFVRCEMKQIPHTPAGVFHMAKPYFTHEVHFTNPVRDLFR